MVQANGLIVLHHGQASVAAGEEVDVKLFAPLEEVGGVKAFTAVLDGLSDDGQIMLIFQDKPITLGKDKISQIRIHFSF